MQKTEYRLATPLDADQLADLRWRLTTDDASTFDSEAKLNFVNEFKRAMATPELAGVHNWVADRNGRVVGVMSIVIVVGLPSPTNLRPRWGYLTNSYVLPDARNHGIGGNLLSAVTHWASSMELELLLVWPSDRSYGFYERSGFERREDPVVLQLQ